MKQAHRRKTFPFQPNPRPLVRHRRKHLSTSGSITDQEGQQVVYHLIEHLLTLAFEREKIRSKFVTQTIKKLSAFDVYDSFYFNLEFQEQPEVLCRQEAEPPHEENRCLEVVKSHVKKKSRTGEEQEISEANGSRMSIVDLDKRDREGIIQKLKKEYCMILQSKYLSESTPIGESRAFFVEGDTPDITNLRKNMGKALVKKTLNNGNNKAAFVKEETRRNNKLNTIYKHSRDFVETIDPTMTNSMSISLIDSQTVSHRGSLATQPPQEPQVVVKLSKFKDISNSISTRQEVASQKNLPPPVPHNTKLIQLISEQERDALKHRLERSFHSNDRTKIREVMETERRPTRPNNAISVSFLPRISRV